MRCPKCGSKKLSVVETRSDERSIRRRRECQDCSHRFSTYEQVDLPLPIVVKKNGSRETFKSEKIRQGLLRACQKLPVSLDDIDRTLAEIEYQAAETGEKEIPSEKIGQFILSALKKLNKIAYLRFVSVYREFTTLEQFQATIEELSD